ncbi:hypothetical protein Q5P01_003053 [Channa striata]|uniref:Uncharacterized protein n=1 Tax=Channa striata TaxID=64152 RepID=A0AA88NS87_CHASR|nr:hypothetical protein Q5P01_003053 [Channa striata]
MVQRNGGSYYTHEMFQEAERAIREEMARLQKENANMRHEEVRKKAERENHCIRAFVVGTAETCGAIAGGFLGNGGAAGAGVAKLFDDKCGGEMTEKVTC